MFAEGRAIWAYWRDTREAACRARQPLRSRRLLIIVESHISALAKERYLGKLNFLSRFKFGASVPAEEELLIIFLHIVRLIVHVEDKTILVDNDV